MSALTSIEDSCSWLIPYFASSIESLLVLPVIGMLKPLILLHKSTLSIVATIVRFHTFLGRRRKRRIKKYFEHVTLTSSSSSSSDLDTLVDKATKETKASSLSSSAAKTTRTPLTPRRGLALALNRTSSRNEINEDLAASISDMKRMKNNSSATLSLLMRMHENRALSRESISILPSMNKMSRVLSRTMSSSHMMVSALSSGRLMTPCSPLVAVAKSGADVEEEVVAQETIIGPPIFLLERIFLKKRTFIVIIIIISSIANSMVMKVLVAWQIKKYLILLSVTFPSLSKMNEMCFSPQSKEFNNESMNAFTIHSLCLIVMILSVTYEIPFVYWKLGELFDVCWTIVYPAGIILCIFEGWRTGLMKGEGEDNEKGEKEVEVGTQIRTASTPSPPPISLSYDPPSRPSSIQTSFPVRTRRYSNIEEVSEEEEEEEQKDNNNFNAVYTPRRFPFSSPVIQQKKRSETLDNDDECFLQNPEDEDDQDAVKAKRRAMFTSKRSASSFSDDEALTF